MTFFSRCFSVHFTSITVFTFALWWGLLCTCTLCTLDNPAVPGLLSFDVIYWLSTYILPGITGIYVCCCVGHFVFTCRSICSRVINCYFMLLLLLLNVANPDVDLVVKSKQHIRFHSYGALGRTGKEARRCRQREGKVSTAPRESIGEDCCIAEEGEVSCQGTADEGETRDWTHEIALPRRGREESDCVRTQRTWGAKNRTQPVSNVSVKYHLHYYYYYYVFNFYTFPLGVEILWVKSKVDK